MLRPGDQIVADGPVVGQGRIEVDESLLTDEADAMTKQVGDRLYSGTFCLDGSTYRGFPTWFAVTNSCYLALSF